MTKFLIRISTLAVLCMILQSCSSAFWAGVAAGTVNYLYSSTYNNTYSSNNTSSNASSGYEKDYQVEDDGFVWYRTETRGKYLSSLKKYLTEEPYGALDKNGKEIIPRSYDSIYYRDSDENGNGYFIVKVDGKEGIYSRTGTCLIPTSRGYTNIYRYSGGFAVEKGDYDGLCDANGKELFSPSKGYTNVGFHEGKDGYKYISAQKDGYAVILDRNGNTVIPSSRRYSTIYRMDYDLDKIYYLVKSDSYEGYCDKNGNEMISPFKGFSDVYADYDSKNNPIGFSVKKGDAYGYCDSNGNEVIPVSRGYSSLFRVKGEKADYFHIDKGEFEGICASDGTEVIVPDTYNSVSFARRDWGDYYYVKKGKFAGLLDASAKAILHPNKYENISLYQTDGVFWCMVVKNGFCGICDIQGKELIVPNKYQYKSSPDNWNISFNKDKNRFVYKKKSDNTEQTLNYSLKYLSKNKPKFGIVAAIVDPSIKTTAILTHTESSNSSGTSTNDNGPIATRTYVQSGQGQSMNTGNWTGSAGDTHVTVQFYEDCILVNGMYCEFSSVTSSGTKVYKGFSSVFNGSSTINYYYVTSEYGMYMMSEYNGFGGRDTFMYQMTAEGEPIMRGAPAGSTSTYGQSGTSSSISGSSSSTNRATHSYESNYGMKDCHLCRGTGICQTCGGDGIMDAGMGNSYTKCPNCSATAGRGKCSMCHGKGKVYGIK